MQPGDVIAFGGNGHFSEIMIPQAECPGLVFSFDGCTGPLHHQARTIIDDSDSSKGGKANAIRKK